MFIFFELRGDFRLAPVLYLVIPCYNEQEVLPITSVQFLDKLEKLIQSNKISAESKILFINDGSKDDTWKIISQLSDANTHISGISLSRNRGHQNALLAGLMYAKDLCDITVSLDCDGQDDIDAVDKMIDAYTDGCDVVYGVRNNRDTDSMFKRTTAQGYYKFLAILGVEVVYNHADYRLLSSKALKALAEFKEVNIYLRGLIPLVGFKSTTVEYSRQSRIAGKSHYHLSKMIALAIEGTTSLSVRPLKFITSLGLFVSLLSFLGIIWIIVGYLMGTNIAGWTSSMCILCFIGGIQLISLGVIGEYIGKIYLEVKQRPRYIISDKTKNI